MLNSSHQKWNWLLSSWQSNLCSTEPMFGGLVSCGLLFCSRWCECVLHMSGSMKSATSQRSAQDCFNCVGFSLLSLWPAQKECLMKIFTESLGGKTTPTVLLGPNFSESNVESAGFTEVPSRWWPSLLRSRVPGQLRLDSGLLAPGWFPLSDAVVGLLGCHPSASPQSVFDVP